MDALSLTCVTPEVKRLLTFYHNPVQSKHELSISNSPAKFASAGFSRNENTSQDEVTCEQCGMTYSGWEGESPFAVHRVLNELCPFLSTPSTANAITNHPRLRAVRRRLFPADRSSASPSSILNNDAGESETDVNSDTSIVSENGQELQGSLVSVLDPRADFKFPFQPKVGDSSMLFASRRAKTFICFKNPFCPDCMEWAEQGFIFRSDSADVQCVYCETVLPFLCAEQPRELHEEATKREGVFCPIVLLKDVGNIPAAVEERIKLKNLMRQLKEKPQLNQPYAISHPQYEEESSRAGTFENWPHSAWDDSIQATAWSEAGFYFTGCADKVVCFCCGVGLYKWRQGSDPWVQHALHMPSCPHVQAKGHNFIQEAAQAEVLTEADFPCRGSSVTPSPVVSPGSQGQLVTSPPGSLTMDASAVTAAVTTSQYTTQQVRHAVLTYFFHTSRFPTKDILLGTLRAAEENFTTVCQQREALFQKDSALQHKDTELQHMGTELQHKDTELQQHVGQLEQRDQELQQHRQELQHKDQVIQHKDQVISQHREVISQHREVISQHREELQTQRAELEAREAELSRRRQQMVYQERQIDSLRVQMQALLAERRQAGLQAAPLQPPAAPAPVPDDEGDSDAGPLLCDIRCKVCLSAESSAIFQPCHHVSCCSACADTLINTRCPVCRAPIHSVLPAYVS